MKKIVCLGEILMRLSPPNNVRFSQATSFDVHYGGSEANVAHLLASLGHNAYFVSRVPNNEIGQAALQSLRSCGVNTTLVQMGGDRLGLYFLEIGASVRPYKVIYDRKASAFAQASVNDFNFNEILKNASWFHFSGITPALGDGPLSIVHQACKIAKEKNVRVSIDINYRQKLWSIQEAQQALLPLMEYVDVCIGNEEHLRTIFGIQKGNYYNDENMEQLHELMSILHQKYNFTAIALTIRKSLQASETRWQALAYDGTDMYKSKCYTLQIVDRVGSGDAFTAGLIAGMLEEKSMQEALEFATAASALKHTIPGDYNIVSRHEIEELLTRDSASRVQR